MNDCEVSDIARGKAGALPCGTVGVVITSIPKAGNPHEVTVVGTFAKLKRKLKITNFFFRSANVFPSETGNAGF